LKTQSAHTAQLSIAYQKLDNDHG